MESSYHNSSKRSLVEEDANISTFRRRNKIIILVFVFLIISLTLIIAALVTELLRTHNSTSREADLLISPIKEFCSLSDAPMACLKALSPIIENRFIIQTDQIFTISLQTAANDLENITSLILSDLGSTELAFKNCSKSLRHGFGQIQDPLAMTRANPFLGSLNDEQRGEMMKRIIAAEDDVESCVDDLSKVNESMAVSVVMAKLLEVKVYLESAKDFLLRYAKVLQIYTVEIDHTFDRGIISENLFSICMCGLQILFVFGMFCSLFRIR